MAGRPSTYSVEVAEEVCERIAAGESLFAVGKDARMPSERTIYQWLERHEEFSQAYVRARDRQADLYAAQIIEIVDREPDAQRARVQMDARKWAASKLAPKKYGDKVGHDVAITGAVSMRWIKDDEPEPSQ